MQPLITNDATVFGILMAVLGLIFYTSKLEGMKRFYSIVPALLLCYFVPALLHWPLGLISPEFFYNDALKGILEAKNIAFSNDLYQMSFGEVETWLKEQGLAAADYKSCIGKSQLYFMSSRYLLPASLVLLCLSIDFKGVLNLGPKALIMFFTATIGIILGGPVALLITANFFPGIISVEADELWRGLATVAGSWIGGGANQTAMKEIYGVSDNLFAAMIVVDVIVANIWMGFLLYGANIAPKIDKMLGADASAIETLKQRVSDYKSSVEKIPTTYTMFVLGAVAFGAVGLSHLGSDLMMPVMESIKPTLEAMRLNSLLSGFFWLIVFATTIGLILSFTPARKLEGVGASNWGSLFIYILVATIGMKMDIGEVMKNMGLFAIGIMWMLVHVTLLLTVAKIIRAPFFFVAVGSQANVGGAASAPIVASAFSPALAPVGVLMAVLGYAMGTYGAIICAMMMKAAAGG